MAKKFAGFKPETLQNKILPALGYNGPTDQASINKFLASSPSAAAKMGKFTMVARQMVEGKPIKADEGVDVQDENTIETTDAEGKRISGSDITENILLDPTGAVSRPTVVGANVEENLMSTDDTKMFVDDQTEESKITATQAVGAEDLVAPETVTTKEGTAQQSQEAIEKAGEDYTAVKGEVSDQATYDATTIDPTKSAIFDLEVAQGEAAQVDAPGERTLQEGELVEGSAVDQSRIEEELAKEQAVLVSEEMARLTKGLKEGSIPDFLAGPLRLANAQLAARGLGASSAAGQAILQAALEGSMDIAKADAKNKQELAVKKAQIRADLLGQEFDEEFRTRVENTATISDIANKNFDAAQEIALENARLTNTMNVENLNAKTASTVAQTAAIASLEEENLNAINTAAKDNAKAFLDMDFKNLDNESEVARVKFQETANAIINDTAERNAMEQLNVVEANDAEQFLLSLATDVARINMEQHNAMEQFNAGEENAIKEFNEKEKRFREEFNAENYRLIEESNAKFKQKVATEEAAAINDAYETEAIAANELSKTAYNNIVMEEKDMMYYAFTGEQSKLDRDTKITTANINAGSGGELEKGISEIAVEITKDIIAKW